MSRNNMSGLAGRPGFEQLEPRLLLSDPPFVDFAGVSLMGVERSSASWADYDNDGDLDILLTGWTGSQTVSKLYRNDGGSFTDVNAALLDVYYGWASWADYDNDGDLDILLTGNTHSPAWEPVSKIYRNDEGGFTDISAPLPGVYKSSASWADYDNDGDLDVLLSGWTGLEHISKVYRNDAGDFIDCSAGLVGVSSGSTSWGDYDNDGDLDALLTGWTGSAHISTVYRNDAGSFTDIGAALAGVSSGSASWADYDSDGDLDILLTGSAASGAISKVYRNEGGSFTDADAGLTGVEFGSASWGDYDNDGDPDILLTGSAASGAISTVYRNDQGSFTEINAGLPGVYRGSTSWGDCDNDGDLDILLTGWTGSGRISKVYRNESERFNAAPSAPTNLPVAVSANQLSFAWDPAADAETPPAGLTYNLRVGTSPGGQEVLCAMGDLSTGLRLLPATGNAQHNLSWTIKGLEFDVAYHWSVQAVDGAFAGSAWAVEQTVTIASVGPTPPSELSATAASASRIDLSWQDNSHNEDGFKIERKVGVSGTWSQVAAVGSNATAYQDTPLAENVCYYYRVRAHNTAGDSPYCQEASATTPETIPAAPSDLAATAASAGRIRLSWQDNSHNEGGFKIERGVVGDGSWAQIAAVGANATAYDDTALSAGTPYCYRARAYNTAGDSPYSNEAEATTLKITVLLDGVEIADGQAAPIDFGSVDYGADGPSKTFTVRNDGGQTLSLGDVDLPEGFSLVEALSAGLEAGQSDTFTVRLDGEPPGTKSGQVSFATSDGGEDPFDFAVTGTVTVATLPPEIAVLLDGIEIADGQTVPIDFGSVDCGSDGPSKTFTVRNDGGDMLTLGDVDLPEGFSLIEALSAGLEAGQSDTFTVQLDGETPGTKSGQVSFVTSDGDENPFDFAVIGTVTNSEPAGADLVVSDTQATTVTAEPGGEVSIQITTANDGDAPAAPDGADHFHTTLYLRSDQNFDPAEEADKQAEQEFAGIAAGESLTHTCTFAAPTQAGTYYLRAMADSSGSVGESDEDNNWGPTVTLTVLEVEAAVIGDGGARAVTCTDADGTRVTVALKGGTAVVYFLGENLQQTPGRKGVTITGGNIEISEIALAGTTARSCLKIGGRGGDGLAAVGEITGSTPLGKLVGKNVDLVGNGISLTGGGVISSIRLHDLRNGADIVMPGASAPAGAKISAGRLGAGTHINLGSYLNNLTAAEWVGGSLIAPWAASIHIKGDRKRGLRGDLGADVTLTGGGAANGMTLKSAKVAGEVAGGTWFVSGHGGAVRFASSAAGWTATFCGEVRSLNVTGNRKSGMAGDLSGAWVSNSLKSVRVAGSVVNAQIVLDQPPDPERTALGRMTVKGWIGSEQASPDVHTWILSSGNIGKVTAGAIGNAAVFAGVTALNDVLGGGGSADGVLDLPDPATGLDLGAGRARIMGLRIKGIKGAEFGIINSNIAAAEFGTVVLAKPKTHSEPVPFGLAADYIKRLTISNGDGKETFTDLDLADQSLVFGHAEIRLV